MNIRETPEWPFIKKAVEQAVKDGRTDNIRRILINYGVTKCSDVSAEKSIELLCLLSAPKKIYTKGPW